MDYTTWSDSQLVGGARRGTRAAFAELVLRHRPLLVALCRRMLGDTGLAEDATQEAVLLALTHLDRLRRSGRFGPWLGGIGLHVCRAWLRYRARDAWSLEALLGGRVLPEPRDKQLAPEAAAEEADLALTVQLAVAELPAGQRAAVALFYLDGLTHAEVAATLGVETGAVKARLHKARRTLRRSLRTAWKEEGMMTETVARSEFVDVHLDDVVRVPVAEPPGERSVLLLAETNGERLLPIWVGAFEGDAAAILLVGGQTQRPLTFPFAARLLAAAGASVREVRVNRLVEETFYAEVTVESPGGTRTIDARPSDAIALALTANAPIRVAQTVLTEAGHTRAELAETRPEGARSARQATDAIRTLLHQATFSTSQLRTLF